MRRTVHPERLEASGPQILVNFLDFFRDARRVATFTCSSVSHRMHERGTALTNLARYPNRSIRDNQIAANVKHEVDAGPQRI